MKINIEISEPKEFNKIKTPQSDVFSVVKRLRALSAAKHDVKQDIISIINKAMVTYGLSPLDVGILICEVSNELREVCNDDVFEGKGKGIHCMSDIPFDDGVPF
ncbi:hypothetical protein M0K80_RS03110 [Providencia rettgeri]|nr:hypothetical protein [Providencia rettgeri]